MSFVVSFVFGDNNNIQYKRVKTEKLNNNKEVVLIEAGSSDNLFFRLGNGFSKKSRETINPMLDKLQSTAFYEALECKKETKRSGLDDYEYRVNTSLAYSSSQLIGFSTFLSYYCGGAYPDFHSTYSLLDTRNAKKYKLEDILSIATDYKKIRDLAFAEAGMTLEPKKNIKYGDDGYDPFDLSHWESLKWELRKKSIRFYLNFSTANRNFRGDYYEISFERLNPYLSKKFIKKLDARDVWVSPSN